MPGRPFNRRRWFGWFRPNFITGMVAWYDPTRQSEADGASVAAITDYSGNAKDMNQATVAKRGTMRRGIRNGRSAIQFVTTQYADPNGTTYDAGDNLDLDSNGFVIYMALYADLTGVPPGNGAYCQIGKGTDGKVAGLLGSYGLSVDFAGGPGGAICFANVDVTFPYNYCHVSYTPVPMQTWSVLGGLVLDGVAPAMYLNGTSVGVVTGTFIASASHTNSQVFGTLYNHQAPAAPTTDFRTWNGYFGEVIVYHLLSLSNDLRLKLDGYFCHKWGLGSSMDPAHPYYHYPP